MKHRGFRWQLLLPLILLLSFFLPVGAGSLASVFKEALSELGLAKGDPRLCVLTNAGYVTLG